MPRGLKPYLGGWQSFFLEGYNRDSEINARVLTGRNGGEMTHPGGAQHSGAALGQDNATISYKEHI